MLSRIEKQLKRRFAIGSQVSEHSIVQDFTKQVGLLWVRRGRGGCPRPSSHPPTPVSHCLAHGPWWGGGRLVLTPTWAVVPPIGTASAWGRAVSLSCEGRGRCLGFWWGHTQAFPCPPICLFSHPWLLLGGDEQRR